MNLLYINNFFNPTERCADHSWYLANDMQFYVLSIIIFTFFNKFLRNVIFTLLFIFSNAFQIYLIYDKNYTFYDFVHTKLNPVSFFLDFYMKPWNRICPFILGLFFCELFLETPLYNKDYNNKESSNNNSYRKINKFLINSNTASFVLLILSLIMISFSVLITAVPNNYELPKLWHALLLTFTKLIFVFGLGCIIHLTFLGKFKIIYKILANKLFSILSRFSYGMYLFHMYIILIFFGSHANIPYFKISEFVFYTIGVIAVSLGVSLIFTILLESPAVISVKALIGEENLKHIHDKNKVKVKNVNNRKDNLQLEENLYNEASEENTISISKY